MGKVRVTTIGDEEQELKAKEERERKKAQKQAREDSEDNTANEESKEQRAAQSNEQPTEAPKEEVKTEGKKQKKEKFIKKKVRSANYTAKVMSIDKNKAYSLAEALELLRKVKMAKFDETVELHINTTESGISGTMKLPHGNGKEVRVVIADDAILAEVEKGKINFDILVAAPSMMPKLARVARVLGPRGLMPNPKNGTISENPEEAAKKFQGGQMGFKTESKMPLIHLSVGKTSFEDSQLSENIKTAISAIKRDRIRKVTLKSTMSPGIRLQV
jgi:large subunit ribosomal protein L1